MALLGPIAFIAIVVSMLFIWLAQRERISARQSRRFRPDWSRSSRTRADGSRRRRRPRFHR
jgi:hypothetical protein